MDPMKRTGNGKVLAEELRHTWQDILEQRSLSQEVEYRIRKMMDRMTPLLGKMYLKTVKGREFILQCAEKTGRLLDHLDSNDEQLYYILTDLEKTYEDLLKRTYEFRIKAG
jgi:hypothetical protein